MKKELFLKTAFSCMACDGEIANEEINLVKSLLNNVASSFLVSKLSLGSFSNFISLWLQAALFLMFYY